MRIAQIAPLFESVPPKMYGGTERVVSYLTEELVQMGHDVTLFAAGDTQTRAKLVAPCARALRLDPGCRDEVLHHVLMLEQVRRVATTFDVLHFHLDYIHLPVARGQATPHITTQHGRLDSPELTRLLREVADVPLVSISDAQRAPMPWANWQDTIYHGLPDSLFTPSHRPGTYLLFVGRISQEKRVDRAIELARKVGMPLKVAAKIGAKDRAYYASVAASLREPFVEFIGEVGQSEKLALMRQAFALVFPIDWPEPFGLVMIEAMACGTPVIAWRGGSVAEIVDDGVTGYVVDSMDDAVRAAHLCETLDRAACAAAARARFSARRMAAGYVRVYQRQIELREATHRRATARREGERGRLRSRVDGGGLLQ